tara:strand:+ start:722 stop:916 length:195 start_codon:yes stop_codon:yes gene_type:complete
MTKKKTYDLIVKTYDLDELNEYFQIPTVLPPDLEEKEIATLPDGRKILSLLPADQVEKEEEDDG